jgi:hypothetical protein
MEVSIMKQILSAYGHGIIQDCAGLLRSLKKQGLSHDDFLEFVEKSKADTLKIAEDQMEKEKPKRPRKDIFLKPGETVLLPGVVCSKCHGEVYIEGLCRHNPLVKQGFVRRGICDNCGAEFNIR